MPPEAIPLSVKEARRSLVSAVVDMYSLKYSRENAMLYDENAIFEDPAAMLEGRAAIASGFLYLDKVVRKSENIKIDIIHGKNLVILDQVQRYTTILGGFSFEMPSVIYLYLSGETGNEKIIHHVEEWRGKALLGKEAPYFANIGFLAAQFRKIHGWPFKYIIPATGV